MSNYSRQSKLLESNSKRQHSRRTKDAQTARERCWRSRRQRHSPLPGGQQPRANLHLDQGSLQTGQSCCDVRETALMTGRQYLQAVGSSQNLTLIVSERTEGEYYCHSITEGYDLLTSPAASILLRRRPRLTSPETQMGQPGELVRLVCSAVSAPHPEGVSWTYLGRTIQPGSTSHWSNIWPD